MKKKVERIEKLANDLIDEITKVVRDMSNVISEKDIQSAEDLAEYVKKEFKDEDIDVEDMKNRLETEREGFESGEKTDRIERMVEEMFNRRPVRGEEEEEKE